MRPASPSAAIASSTSKTAASPARRATRLLLHSLSAPGGGEGWGEVGDSRAVAETHLTLPSLRDGPLPLPPEGRRGIFALVLFEERGDEAAQPLGAFHVRARPRGPGHPESAPRTPRPHSPA